MMTEDLYHYKRYFFLKAKLYFNICCLSSSSSFAQEVHTITTKCFLSLFLKIDVSWFRLCRSLLTPTIIKLKQIKEMSKLRKKHKNTKY